MSYLMHWDFGDGTSTQAEPTHIFNSVGSYTVIMSLTGGPTLPTADFSSISSGVNTVSFTNLSVDATSCFWDFGDNTPHVFFQNPLHIFDGTGSYNVTQTAINGVGSDSTTKIVLVT
jgi:PKD repeat protein